jgi:hypothetical protein
MHQHRRPSAKSSAQGVSWRVAPERVTAARVRLHRVLLTGVALLALAIVQGGVATAGAGAFAGVGAAPTPGPSGLSDGRVYQEVSPPNKNGNAAGLPLGGTPPVMFAEAEGNAVVYSTSGGAIGKTRNGSQFFIAARRLPGAPGAFSNEGTLPRAIGEQALLDLQAEELGFSANLTKAIFRSDDQYLPGVNSRELLAYDMTDNSVTWLEAPPASPADYWNSYTAGYSEDMSTIYLRTEKGFFEWHEGVESEAGVLPDGSVEPDAVPAGLPYQGYAQASQLRNQVSLNGTRAFFVATAGTPQLYVRETEPNGTQRTVLASRDTLLAPVDGYPAPAPHGIQEIGFPREGEQGEESGSVGYAYAAPDGSRVFFVSEDQLTASAPSGGGMYELDTVTESLTYLPGVGHASILGSSRDGSRLIFDNENGTNLWAESGPEGGTVTPIESLPITGEVRATPDGSVFVFDTTSTYPGFNNGGTHPGLIGQFNYPNEQVYRYDVSENSLTCVSCPPRGIVPTGSAYISHDLPSSNTEYGQMLSDNRAISANGSRVFFDSPDPLVPQDVNTRPTAPNDNGENLEYGRDVYEWENGKLFLISSGTSTQNSYIGDNSETGDDVFFSTAQGLAPGDTDEAYDVYDASVPRPEDDRPLPPARCQGDVCQGPPSVPVLLGAPASATFSGLGNPQQTTPAATAAPSAKTKPKAKPNAKRCPRGKHEQKGRCVSTHTPVGKRAGGHSKQKGSK